MRKPRRWIKVYCNETLHGSVAYQLTLDERYCWIALLLQAGLCDQDGLISDHDGRAWPHEFLAHEIHAPIEVLESTLDKCKTEGRITENGNGITIVNWPKYQSEYARQKQYRQRDDHLFVNTEERQAKMQAANEKHIAAWESAHPGQIHPSKQIQADEE